MENSRRVEYHGVDAGELLEDHGSETQEQTAFGRSGSERLRDRNSVPFRLRKKNVIYFIITNIDIIKEYRNGTLFMVLDDGSN